MFNTNEEIWQYRVAEHSNGNYSSNGSFVNALIDLIHKADRDNTEKLYQVYPDAVNAVWLRAYGKRFSED